MKVLEKEIEAKLRKAVEKHGGMCLKWVCPGWSGVPDRIVLLPVGRIVFVELKRPEGSKTSRLQKWWAKKLIDLGFHYWQLDDEEDLELFAYVELQQRAAWEP